MAARNADARRGARTPPGSKHVPSTVPGAAVSDASAAVSGHFAARKHPGVIDAGDIAAHDPARVPPATTPMTAPASTSTRMRPGGGVLP